MQAFLYRIYSSWVSLLIWSMHSMVFSVLLWLGFCPTLDLVYVFIGLECIQCFALVCTWLNLVYAFISLDPPGETRVIHVVRQVGNAFSVLLWLGFCTTIDLVYVFIGLECIQCIALVGILHYNWFSLCFHWSWMYSVYCSGWDSALQLI